MPTPRQRPRRKPAPVETRDPHPRAWEEALRLAEGRPVVLEPLPDGSVRIANRPER